MGAVGIKYQQVTHRVLADGFTVYEIVMVGFEIAIHRDLPPRTIEFADLVQMPIFE